MSEHARLFMKLTGETTGVIKGESVVAARKDMIELEDWNWKLARAKKGAAADAVEPSVFGFSKRMDTSSSVMLKAMTSGELLEAEIRIEDSSLNMVAMTITLHAAQVIGYDLRTQVSEKSNSVDEEWVLDYKSIEFEYRENLDAGWMQVEVDRPAGSSTDSPTNEKKKQIMLLTKDMSVQDLANIWDEIKAASAVERSLKPDSEPG
jgi:type VI secretion system Hcp family effector